VRRPLRKRGSASALLLTLAASLITNGCADDDRGEAALVALPSDFPPLPQPADNPLTVAKVRLGQRLFFDPILSRTNEIACASCHLQAHGFADRVAVSRGVDGRTGMRNAPGLANLAYATSLFWDGGVDSLERQAIAPIKDMNEMDQPLDTAVAKVAADPSYRADFAAAFADEPAPTAIGLTRALASYVRTLVSGDSRWDRHRRGDATALSASEQRGRALFFGEKAECFHCHDGLFLTNNRFANNGSYRPGGDVGRQRVTLRAVDLGRFRVPSLRNVAVTAPYMHDGSLATLQDVVDHYARGGRGHGAEADAAIDPVLRPLALDDGDKADLIAFLTALTDEAFLRDPRLSPPAPAP
jgi:cytochrome c peroxidase